MLRFYLFGAPQFEDAGAAVPLRRSKPLALLAYLALSDQPRDRETLLALLWPEFDASSARNNLRRELSHSKAVLGIELLHTDRRQVRWSPQTPVWIDVITFGFHLASWKRHDHPPGALCAACAAELAVAVHLYRDDFLAGFSLPDSPAFDEWQFFQREALRHELASVLQALIAWYGGQGVYDRALIYARHWLALDGLHEPAHRELMRLYALSGQQAAALRQYDTCARLLDKELGAEPEAETRTLRDAIHRKRLTALAVDNASPRANERASERRSTLDAALPNMPPISALPRVPGFVGRRRELASLLARLTDPDCRLLSLIGPGGIGKTRLALEAAHTIATEWAGDAAIADGVLWVPLAAVPAPSGMVTALAAAAGLDFAAAVSPQQQLVDALRAKRMLVVLDNVEHLLGGVDLLAALLAAAPGLRLLVTSREALNLREEWLQPVAGLSFPRRDEPVTDADILGRFDAVRLFELHARRLRPDFAFHSDYRHVVRLCRLVEGTPLALELAASWLKTLSVAEVAAALGGGLDILTSRDRNMAERHRSMRLVLEQSWRQLSSGEQQVLARLTVFRGGFSAPAAETVAGAALTLLAMLVDKSLVRSESTGRFQLHELVRQFAAERLADDLDSFLGVHARHSRHYLDFLAERKVRLLSGERHLAVAEIGADDENVAAAWRWAVAHDDLEHIDRGLGGCFEYYEARSYCQAGDELFGLVVEALSDTPRPADTPLAARVRVRALIRRAAFRTMLGAYRSAAADFARGLAQAQAMSLSGEVAYVHLWQGFLARWRGDPATARHELEATLAIATPIGDQFLVGQARCELAQALLSAGDVAAAKGLAQESVVLLRAVGRKDLVGRALDRLALVLTFEGSYSVAEEHWRESLALAEEIGNQAGAAGAIGGIGWAIWCGGGRLQEARAQLEHALAIVRRLGLRLPVANFLADLAIVALDEGDVARAEAYAQEGIGIARALDSMTYQAYHLGVLAQVATTRGEFEVARRSSSEALRIAVTQQLWPNLGRTMFFVADLLLREAASMGSSELAVAARQARAVELLTAIAQHPASWHVYRSRARQRRDEVLTALPAALGEQAAARGQQFDWQTSIPVLADELVCPA